MWKPLLSEGFHITFVLTSLSTAIATAAAILENEAVARVAVSSPTIPAQPSENLARLVLLWGL
jgi:zinc transporter ZupT